MLDSAVRSPYDASGLLKLIETALGKLLGDVCGPISRATDGPGDAVLDGLLQMHERQMASQDIFGIAG